MNKKIESLEQANEELRTQVTELQEANDLLTENAHYLCAWVVESQTQAIYIGEGEFFFGSIIPTENFDSECAKQVEIYKASIPERRKDVLDLIEKQESKDEE